MCSVVGEGCLPTKQKWEHSLRSTSWFDKTHTFDYSSLALLLHSKKLQIPATGFRVSKNSMSTFEIPLQLQPPKDT
jgi:hypothetical protein